ncbi:MCE family protein, partial [Actinomadura sp. 7K507]
MFGVAAVAGAAALSGCSFNGVSSLPLPGGPDLGPNPKTVKIEFSNVLDLVPQSAVKVNDVSVGQVEEIDL